eukprot:4730536-Pleurochrysis_carterae.AAC.4
MMKYFCQASEQKLRRWHCALCRAPRTVRFAGLLRHLSSASCPCLLHAHVRTSSVPSRSLVSTVSHYVVTKRTVQGSELVRGGDQPLGIGEARIAHPSGRLGLGSQDY